MKSKYCELWLAQVSTSSADKYRSCDEDDTEHRGGRNGLSSRMSAPSVSDYCSGGHSARRALAIYCRDCCEPVCEACFIQLHNGHVNASVDEAAAELRTSLRKDVDNLSNISLEYADRLNVMQVSQIVVVVVVVIIQDLAMEVWLWKVKT